MKMPVFATPPAKDPPAAPLRLVPAPRTEAEALATLDSLNPVRRFLDTVSPASRRPVETHLRRVARLLRVPLSGVPWHLLRAHHIETLRATLSELCPEGARSKEARLSPATVNGTLAAVRGVMRACRALRLIEAADYALVCEVSNVRGVRVKSSARALTLDEVARLLAACRADSGPRGARDAALLALMAGAGLRRAELVALRLSDWRARTHALLVRGKGDKERLVYLEDGGARRALLDWLQVRGREPGALLTPIDHEGRVLARHLTGQAVYNAVEKRRRQARIHRLVSPHDLRHFYADHLRERGAQIEDVQELLGHASITTTAHYYHGGERAKHKAAKLIRLPYAAAGGRGGRRRRRGKRRRRFHKS